MTQHERDLARYRKHIARGYREGRTYVSLPLTIAAELLAGYDAALELRSAQGQPTPFSARPGQQETKHDRHPHSNG